MTAKKSLFATMGLGAVLAVGVFAAGAAPAKADGFRISDHNGRVGFSLSIGNDRRYAPVCETPVYVAPRYEYRDRDDYRRYDRDDHSRFDRDDHRRFDRDDSYGHGWDRRDSNENHGQRWNGRGSYDNHGDRDGDHDRR